MGSEKHYRVDVWFEDAQWRAALFVTSDKGDVIEEIDAYPSHNYLLNTMNYAGQAIEDHERGL